MQRAIIVASLLVAATASAVTLEISSARRVILRSGMWTPSQAEVDAAFKCAQHFLATPSINDKYQLSQIALIRQHAREYRVQFLGRYHKGKKVILCNFFPVQFPEEKQDGFYYWKQQLVEVMDGGFWFWRLEYDPQLNSCSEFSSNGYA